MCDQSARHGSRHRCRRPTTDDPGRRHPAFWPHFTPQRFTTGTDKPVLDAVRASAPPRVERVLAHLDGLIGDTGHVDRGRRSVADAYAFVMARWSRDMPKGWRDFPGPAGFMRAMEADPAVARILEQSRR